MVSGIRSGHSGAAMRVLRAAVPDWFAAMFFGGLCAKKLHFEKDASKEFDGRGYILPISALKHDSADVPQRRVDIVDVVLPASVLLKRAVAVPLSSPASQYAVAELDLLRRTPFGPEDVYWAIDAPKRGPVKQVTQWIAKAKDIQRFRKRLLQHGFQVRRFMIAADESDVAIADFTSEISPYGRIWRRSNGALGAVCVAIAAVMWLTPAWQARAETARETAIVDDLRLQALGLRREIEQLNQIDSARTEFVNAVMLRPRLVDALRQITVALPDSVWVSDLLFSGGQITIRGETSESAAGLVLQLTQENLNYVPALTGPVSRTSNGTERFGLVFSSGRQQQ